MKAKTSRPKQQRKSIQQVVHYALGHKTRVHILIVLNEGAYTAAQIADLIDEPTNNVANHLKQLLDAGSIEIAREERSGNITKYWYRACEPAYYTKEDAEEMSWEHRQVVAGLALQWSFAEAMAALWAGTLADPQTWIYGSWHQMDEQGRKDLDAEQEAYAKRVKEIEIESLNRSAVSGKETTSMLVSILGYQRARRAPRPPS